MQSILLSLRRLWGSFRQLTPTTQVASGILLVMAIVLGGLNFPSQPKLENTSTAETKTLSFPTQTVGADDSSESGRVMSIGARPYEAFATVASWPGEVISPNDTDVQPPREGAIVSWNVSIGEYVNKGQVLGNLSATSLTPELATTLAEQAATLAKAKAQASRTKAFVGQTKIQLDTFSGNDTSLQAIENAKKVAEASGETVRSVLRQSIIREFADFSGNDRNVLALKDTLYLTQILWYFGATNMSLRDKYLIAVGNTLAVLEKKDVPQEEGVAYFLSATTLAAASISGSDFTQAKLDEVRKDIREDQASFNDAVLRYRDALLNVSEKQKEYAERIRDTGTKISELDRDNISAQSELETAEASYRLIASAITGGSAIVAPKSGYVSAIVSQIGDFVSPGKAVASISSGVQTNKIIRFRIPSNVEVPKKGDKVRIVRPGFAKDIRIGVVAGVGTALDGNGAFMADAKIEGALDWPAHLSVRVVPEKRTSQSITVPFDAVFWNEENRPQIWLVGEGGIVSSRAIRTGRTFGDAVEILDGLKLGDTYLSQASEIITEGMRILETVITTKESATTEGDGHGHAHDE